MAAGIIATNQYNLLPGRLRISIKGLRQNSAYAHYLTERLIRERNIRSVTANPLTGRALIHFDTTYIGLTEIQSLLSAIEQTYLIQKTNSHKIIKSNCSMPHDAAKAPAAYALTTGLVLTALIIKRFLAGRSRLASSPQIFNLAALATLIAGYPLLRNKFETAAKKNNINYELMLFLPTLALLIMRENITGLSVFWLVQLTYWLGVAAQEDSHKNITNLLMKKQLALANPSEPKNPVQCDVSAAGNNLITSDCKSLPEHNPSPSSVLFAEKFMWWSWAIAGATLLLTKDFRRSLAVLLAGCPAAVSLSRNAALHTAVGEAARKGVFVKEIEVLERIGEVDTVLFDKTGTLTTSHPIIAKIIPLTPDYNENEVLILAASAEAAVNHPLANMLLREVQCRELTLLPVNRQSQASLGVQAAIADKTIAVGNRLFMQRKKIPVAKAKSMILALEQLKSSILYVAVNNQLIGIMGIKDVIRPESYAGIDRLRALGIQDIAIITGDSALAAKSLAAGLGLTASWDSMLPEDKVRIITDLQNTGKKIVMIGDGTNDAPAFAASDVGIAMGEIGTFQAIDKADIVIANDNPQNVAEIIRLSRYTNRVIQQNVTLAAASNIVGMALAATSLITPVTAGLLLNISTLAIIMNSKSLLSRNSRPNENPGLNSSQVLSR